MDVSLTAEQRMVGQATRALAGADGASLPGGGRPDPAAVWSALVDSGFVPLRVPAERGGGGAGAVELAVVTEHLAAAGAAVPYLCSVLALELAAATPFDDLVAAMVAGKPGAVILGDDLLGLSDHGVAVGAVAGAVILGVVDGDLVTGEVVTGDVATAEAVSDGQGSGELDGIDPGRPLAAVTRGRVLARLDDAVVARWEVLALALLSADLVGAMQGALDGAVAHAAERHQFGRPIGSFQAVAHLCADAAVSVEAARSATWHAAWAVDALDAGDLDLAAARRIAATAKAWCSEAGREVCETAIQVWGGLGMTWECDAHRHLRRALLSRALLGDEGHHLSVLAGLR